MKESLINTPEQLIELCSDMQNSDWLCVDTEFFREKTYYPKLCLIQIADNYNIACIDPIAIKDLQPLWDILYSPILKILHAPGQDLEIFCQLKDKVPTPLFDTQHAAALVGYGDQMSYAALVKQLLNVDLDKTCRRTDWTRRPLSNAQIHYAMDDVRYLGSVFHQLQDELAGKERLAWLQADMEACDSPSKYVTQPQDAWQKVRGCGSLKSNQIKALQDLAEWREKLAIEKNSPRRWICSDIALMDMARTLPTSAQQLYTIASLNKRLVNRHEDTLITIIRAALHAPKTQLPERCEQLTQPQTVLCGQMMALLQQRAQQYGINPTTLAPRKTLEQLVLGKRDSNLVQGWRYNVVGQALLDMIEQEQEQ